MSADSNELEDDKTHVRSTMDAMGDRLTKNGRAKGRPRKFPLDGAAPKKRRKGESPIDDSEEDEEMADDGPSEEKKSRREADDEDWSEEHESLTASQRRVRKGPMRYSDEAAIKEAQRKRLSSVKRGRGRGRPSHGTGRGGPPHTMSPLATLPKEQQALIDELKRKLEDIDNPKQARKRIWDLLTKENDFEKGLARILPVPGPRPHGRPDPDLSEILHTWRTNVMNIACSAGFLEFIWHLDCEAVLAIYTITDSIYYRPMVTSDELGIAQTVRFCWNSLPWATRRKWERVARKRVMERRRLRIHGEAAFEGHEIPVSGLTEARIQAEDAWLARRNFKQAIVEEEEDAGVFCPLCYKDDTMDDVRMGTMQQIQEHFFHAHWQVHGYACHFCGIMYSTLEELKVDHTECDEWMAYRAASLLAGGNVTGKIELTVGRMMVCCAECGWHVPLSRETGAIEMVKTLMAHHHNDSLLTMMIYFPAKPSEALESVRFKVTPMSVKKPQLECTVCDPPVAFRDPVETNNHFMKHHSELALKCHVCNAKSATEFLFKQHQLAHIGEHSYLADFLQYTARVMPPPKNLSHAPRVGWKNKIKGQHAVGGIVGGVGLQTPIDIVDPFENCEDRKVRNLRKRKSEGSQPFEDGFENAAIETEEADARAVRMKLMQKYSDCEGVGGIDDTCWLRQADAKKLKEWMAYWESAEGKRKGGPPKEIVIDMTPSIVSLPTIDVEIYFKQTIDEISGSLLNDNVFYCFRCDVILKGEQAREHLEQKGKTGNSCAKQDNGKVGHDPFLNDNLFTLHVPTPLSDSVHCPALPCPHCPKDAATGCCSIAGLRLHMLQVHDTYVGYEPVAGPIADVSVVAAGRGFKWDLRTPFGRSIDALLCMPPSGMFAQKPHGDLYPGMLTEQTWSQLTLTTENTTEEEIESWRMQIRKAHPMPNQLQRPSPLYNHRPQIQTVPTARPLQQMQLVQQQRAAEVQRATFAERARQQKIQQQIAAYSGRGSVSLSPLLRGINRPIGVAQPQQHLQQGPSPQLQHQLQLQQQKKQNGSQRNGGAMMGNVRRILGFAMIDRARVYVCNVCNEQKTYENLECFKAHIMRRHFHTCGHCTAIFVFDHECRYHAASCRNSAAYHELQRLQQTQQPDPRLPHVKTKCPFCSVEAGIVEMPIHLMDSHIDLLEFETPRGRLRPKVSLVPDQELPKQMGEVVRLRYKYYLPREDDLRNARGRNCQVCGLVFPDPGKLIVHLKFHPEFAYFCWVCPRKQAAALGTVTEIARHIITDHFAEQRSVQKFMPCPLCRTNMINRPLPHLMYECTHHLICQLCRDLPTFESVNELQAHRERCHYDTLRRFECSQCTGFFSTVYDFRRHICNQSMLRTNCDCGAELQTRICFEQHYATNHLRGDVCKICNIKCVDDEAMKKHRDSHAKVVVPEEARHLLICSYGDIAFEEKTLLVLVSNTSIRMKDASKYATGGTLAEPLELSDDDDIIEISSTAVQAEQRQLQQQQQQEDGMPDLQQPPLVAISSPQSSTTSSLKRDRSSGGSTMEGAADEDVVDFVVKRIVKAVVYLELKEKEKEAEEMREKEKQEQEQQRRQSPMADTVDLEDDDDCVMIDETETDKAAALSATIREEQVDNSVGGRDQPGYAVDEEEEGETPPNQAIIREFTPDGDDDLCVVGEVENPGCTGAAISISKQREKKYACDKCSQRFITPAALKGHLKSSHQFDAGASTISEELGIPFDKMIFICKNCCIAFPTIEMHRIHRQQHGGQRTYSCETCSGCAYNNDVMSHHQRRVQERKVSYVCGECRMEFEHETNLHEHSSLNHGVRLFYFCKSCEIGSTDGDFMYAHYMTECRSGFSFTMGRNGRRGEENASSRIGVCPASQLHYQPQNLDMYKKAIVTESHKFARPSLCNHRSLLVAVERMVACDECRCLVNIQTYAAESQLKTGVEFDLNTRLMKGPPPLHSLKQAYHNPKPKQRMNNADKHLQAMRAASSSSAASFNGVIGRPPPAAAPYAGPSHNFTVTPGVQHQQQQQHPHLQQSLTRSNNLGGGFRYPVGVIPANAMVTKGRVAVNSTLLYEAQQRRTDTLQAFTQARGNGVIGRSPSAVPHLNMRGGATMMQVTMQGGEPRMRSHAPPHRGSHEFSTLGSLQSLVANSRQQDAAGAARSAESTPSPSSRQCTFCAKDMLTDRDVFLHSLHIKPPTIVCAACPIAFANERIAVGHMIDHLQPDERRIDVSMDCPVPSCATEIPTLIALRRHMVSVHNPPLRFTNPSCTLTFKTKELAEAHDLAHMNSNCPEEMQCCVLCGTVDNWASQMLDKTGKGLMISHLMVHALQSNIYCKICLLKHDNVNQLVTHFLLSHTNEENDTRCCDECDVPLGAEIEIKAHCAQKHMITEFHVPKKLTAKVPPAMAEFLGISASD